MRTRRGCGRRIRDLADTDMAAEELGRLARVDALLRAAAAHEGAACAVPRPVEARPAPTTRASRTSHELRLTSGELALIYKALQAARTLGAFPPQDELLDDTIQLVDQALNGAA